MFSEFRLFWRVRLVPLNLEVVISIVLLFAVEKAGWSSRRLVVWVEIPGGRVQTPIIRTRHKV